jgi:Flp pilus assembly protein CpaB
MNNKNKIILGVAISYFVIVSLVAMKLSRAGTGDDDEKEDIESEEEKKVE